MRVMLSVSAVILALVLAARVLGPEPSTRPDGQRPTAESPASLEAPVPDERRRPEKLDVQGHRGARGLRPENTLVAFDEALRLGVSTVELDLGVTLDGAVVVAHDPYIHPEICLWPDGEPIADEQGPLLRDMRLDEVQQFDCGSLNPDPVRYAEPPRENVPGASIPTLDEVFDLARQRSAREVRFNIEIKHVPGSDDTVPLDDFVRTVIDVVRKYDMVERTTLQSFDWRALELADRIEPRLQIAALWVSETDEPKWHAGLVTGPGEALPDVLARLDAEVDVFSPYWEELATDPEDPNGVAAFQERGIRVVPWTVDDETTMRQLIEAGVDGIISDRPDRLLDLCRELGIPVGV